MERLVVLTLIRKLEENYFCHTVKEFRDKIVFDNIWESGARMMLKRLGCERTGNEQFTYKF